MKKEEYEIKWWKKWLEADCIRREELVSKLPIINQMCEANNLPLEMKKRMFTRDLNGFFEDLENALYTKIRNDKIK